MSRRNDLWIMNSLSFDNVVAIQGQNFMGTSPAQVDNYKLDSNQDNVNNNSSDSELGDDHEAFRERTKTSQQTIHGDDDTIPGETVHGGKEDIGIDAKENALPNDALRINPEKVMDDIVVGEGNKLIDILKGDQNRIVQEMNNGMIEKER